MGDRIDKACFHAFHWKHCVLWKENLFLLIASLATTVLGIRMLTTVALYIVPLDSYAGGLVVKAYVTPWGYFLATVGIASLGGIVSLLHKLRSDTPQNIDFLAALGHLSASQLAGLFGYFIAMEFEWSPWVGLTMCGLFGWGGNKAIARLNDIWLGRYLPPGDAK